MPETINQLEAQGFTAIDCYCEPCRRSVWVWFATIKNAKPGAGDMTVQDVGKTWLRCGNCGAKATTYKETAQHLMPGHGRLT